MTALGDLTLLLPSRSALLMWKTYRLFPEVDAQFMTQLRACGLRVLMFIHSSDERKLKRMVDQGIDYVSTLAHHMETFKKLAASA